MVRRANRLRLLILVVFAGLLGSGVFTGSAWATGCNKYASPSGSDYSGNGGSSRPFQTPARLDSALSPGQTGCLQAGTYGSISAIHQLDNSGSPGDNITITAAPGEQATVSGLVDLRGSYTTLSGLTIDGSNNQYSSERSGTTCPYPVSNGLEIDGSDDIFQYNNLFQSVPSLRGNGIGVGWNAPADGTIIRFNRLHDFGQCDAFDQVIYLDDGTGVQIYDNWMWGDQNGFGVQLYPYAVDAHVYNNVIDGVGAGFGVGDSSAGNVIDHNVVMDSTGLPDAGLDQGAGITDPSSGSGNAFVYNDVFNTPIGADNSSILAVGGNITGNPDLVDPAAHDYAVPAGSPLASWGLWDGGASPTASPTNTPAHPRTAPRASIRTRRRRAHHRVVKRKRARHKAKARARHKAKARKKHKAKAHKKHKARTHKQHRRHKAKKKH